jgi:FemAB-related protein (PEP-CTERM system-associated)
MMRVERVDPVTQEWDTFVRGQHGWTHFHLAGWKTVMESALGHECIYLVARDPSEALAGVLPLVRVRSLLFGHYLVSMPFVNYGAPLGSSAAIRALADHTRELADRDSAKLAQLRSRGPLDIEWPVSHEKVTTVLELPDEEGELWNSFPSKMRTKIRRPEKDGVEVHFGADRVADFFAVFSRHMRDLGTPTHSLTLFETILRQFPDSTLLGCAYYDGEPIGCGLGFIWNGEFEMTWSCALREHKTLRANMLLYWAFMRELIARDVSLFNFGRSTPGGGTHQFKLQWGAQDQPLHWYHHSPSGVTKAPSPQDERYSWGPRLWRRLPSSIATAIGPRIVRYIP